MLRDYQKKAVDEIIQKLILNPILVSPTGSGKTYMGVHVVKELEKRTLWIAHREELLVQAKESLEQFGLPVGVISGRSRPSPLMNIQVASIQTLAARFDNEGLPECSLVVVDECHHAAAATYQGVLREAQDRGVPILGMTATPFRLDGRGLGFCGFGAIVEATSTRALVEEGFLHNPHVYAGTTMPDLRKVGRVMGDYRLSQLADAMNKPDLVGDVVATWKRLANDLPTICFAVDIEHSRSLCNEFNRAGVKAVHVDGGTGKDERSSVKYLMTDCGYKVLCNVNLFTEGWDLPMLECCIIARPTASLCLHLQMLGRIMRLHQGKDGCLVLDHAGNHLVHGPATRPIAYSLGGSILDSAHGYGMTTCPECYAIHDRAQKQCPSCGYIPLPSEKNAHVIRLEDGTLVEYSDSDFFVRDEYYKQLCEAAELMGYKPGWIAYRYYERFGVWPTVTSRGLLNVDEAGMDDKREVYKGLLQKARENGYKDGWASHKYKDQFGVWPGGFVDDVKKELDGDSGNGTRSLKEYIEGKQLKVTPSAITYSPDDDDEEDLF